MNRKQYKKLLAHAKQTLDFQNLKPDKNIQTVLNTLEFKTTSQTKKLNEVQKLDINKALQKQYSYINWACGTGKTLAIMSMLYYRLLNKQCKKVFIVAPANAIQNTLKTFFDYTKFNEYGLAYTILEKNTDLDNSNDIILISEDKLYLYKQQLKKCVKKIQPKNIFLIVDEAHKFSNYDSKKTRAILGIFKKAKYKTLLSATPIKNNISELYTQLLLLYKNSNNFKNHCKYITTFENNKKEVITNTNYNKPFKIFKKGLTEFKNSFCNSKIKLFKNNEIELNNLDKLNYIQNYTFLKKSFKDVVGYELLEKPIFENLEMNDKEKVLYNKLIENLKNAYSNKNPLNIVSCMLDLIRATTTPNLFEQNITSNKLKYIAKIIQNKNKSVVGLRFKEGVNQFADYLKKYKKVYVITGDNSLKQRSEIIEQMKKDDNYVLVCTQQSISESINIPFIDNIIIPELAWNNETLEQFYMRFVRYDSKKRKNLFYVNYKNSIETNLFLMSKQKGNLTKKLENKKLFEITKELLANTIKV